ncbi:MULTISPECIES: response regulator transcription factor [unclassified Enterobacter]|jgi:two-component system response regulator EvgA|uniref:response regulator transcription factor n=1 Tax=unclassified Enterobacter TaxID=2608935 RepID=UPI0015C782A3|nr:MULTISPECIES: response regulator transcription factor [unclassified Enterobacter]MBB3306710.1 two-component system response regulator EvgA [Enterobacter sp. Sphag1F]NYI15965.1 two-component system response regulator EvgA [Enterobacter sp. Sphag71]
MKKIVIYDNNPLVIAGLNYFLSQQGFNIIGSTTRPDELFRHVILLKPDFIILDPASLKEEYLSRLCDLKKMSNNLNIVIYAGSESVYHILRGYQLNWMAYLSKSQPLEALYSILHLPKHSRPLLMDIQTVSPHDDVSVQALSSLRSLTGREMQVLREIGAGKTNKEIADELRLSNKTISTYKRNIMDKFHTNDVRDVVDIARRHGF